MGETWHHLLSNGLNPIRAHLGAGCNAFFQRHLTHEVFFLEAIKADATLDRMD
jgi:hypothetical protein